MMSGMSGRHCCWDDHTCPRPAVAAVVWGRPGDEQGYSLVCDEHLVLVQMKASIRGLKLTEHAPDVARGGQ